MARGRWTLLFIVGLGVCPLIAPGAPPSHFAATADKRPQRSEPPATLDIPPASARTAPSRSPAIDHSPAATTSPAVIPSRSTASPAPLVHVPAPSFVAPTPVTVAEAPVAPAHFAADAPFASRAPVAPAPLAPSAPLAPLAPRAAPTALRPAPLVPLYASFAALQGLDYASTRSALENGAQEANPLMRSIVKNPPAFIAVKAAATAGVIVAGEKMWKKNRVGAVLFVAGANAAMAIVVGRNYAVR